VQERRFAFDAAFNGNASNADVFKRAVADLVDAVPTGINATIFAYGATGSGKTHTMLGTGEDPGLMARSLVRIFELVEELRDTEDVTIEASYLEVYNEVIIHFCVACL
jgi:kinesin family member 18/19